MNWSSTSLLLLLILIGSISCGGGGKGVWEKGASNSCDRDCDKSWWPRVCEYEFTLEWYEALSRSCLQCGVPGQEADCFNKNCISLDGVQRAVNVVNRELPGPLIEVCLGDTIVVKVVNKMTQTFSGTSIHWHGIQQRNSQWMDGVSQITQCPINPVESFRYEFKAQEPGTYFWHSHSGMQRTDGIFGGLVVRQARDINRRFYNEDLSEHVIVLNDWINPLTVVSKYEKFLHDYGDEFLQAILINGRGKGPNESASFSTPYSTFVVTQGKRYRFRLIDSGMLYCPLEVSIENHYIAIIATDGNPTEPLRVASVVLYPGERYDFVLHADKSVDNYWIKVKGLNDCANNQIFQLAVLRYQGAAAALPASTVTYNMPVIVGPQLGDNNIIPTIATRNSFIGIARVSSARGDEQSAAYIRSISVPNVRKIFVALDMNVVNNPDIFDSDFIFAREQTANPPFPMPQFTNITFKFPRKPFYYQDLHLKQNEVCNAKDREAACPGPVTPNNFCSCVHIEEIALNEVVELILVDGGTNQENHPIHLHGNSFAILSVVKVPSYGLSLAKVKQLDRENRLQRNFDAPPIKDTIALPTAAYAVIRFKATNPGYWLMHCHNDFHAETGMIMVFKVGEVERHLPPAPLNWPRCGSFP